MTSEVVFDLKQCTGTVSAAEALVILGGGGGGTILNTILKLCRVVVGKARRDSGSKAQRQRFTLIGLAVKC